MDTFIGICAVFLLEEAEPMQHRYFRICMEKGEKMLGVYLEKVRESNPLIHNITNYVTVNDVANILLACGASPIMSDEEEEAEEITAVCRALNINIGTLNRRTIPAMFAAGKKAKELGHPVLLDPVGVGAGSLRTKTARELMQEISFDVIRGNSSEIRTLAGMTGSTRGVDAGLSDAVTEDNLQESIAFLKKFAEQTGAVIAVTGAIDLVADQDRCYVIRNGRPEMGRITGTGCQLSGMMTAFLAASPDERLSAAAAAVCTMGLAGEAGWSHMEASDGNTAYRGRIIDAVYHMHGAQLEEGARYEIR